MILILLEDKSVEANWPKFTLHTIFTMLFKGWGKRNPQSLTQIGYLGWGLWNMCDIKIKSPSKGQLYQTKWTRPFFLFTIPSYFPPICDSTTCIQQQACRWSSPLWGHNQAFKRALKVTMGVVKERMMKLSIFWCAADCASLHVKDSLSKPALNI